MLYTAQKQISDNEMHSLAGRFFDVADCYDIINTSSNIVMPNGELLCSLDKSVISPELSKLAVDAFKKKAKVTTTNTRGMASGKVDITKVPGNIVELLEPDKFASKVRYSNGNVSNHLVSNKTHSMIAGFYDKPKRGSVFNGFTNARLTSFCEKYTNLWNNYGIPFIRNMDKLYSERFPQDYYKRKQQSSKVQYGMIDQTIFTTATVNYNFQTAAHVDKGNLQGGYSVLTCHGEWSGGYLIYPQYRIGIEIKDGDFLIMNPHEYHCNSAIFPSPNGVKDRLSIVLYARDKIVYN